MNAVWRNRCIAFKITSQNHTWCGPIVLYHSTRGGSSGLSFDDALLAGLAPDGGLYVPDSFPTLSQEAIRAMRGRPYAQVAYEVISPFVGGSIEPDALRTIIEGAYGTFRHTAVAPLVQLDETHWALELFHGQTLAFKDVAMQFLARAMDHVLAERGSRATIVGATSGDTGGAAIDAFLGRARTDMFILFPDGRVSDVQRRQMTTSVDANVHALAIDGTFDDCQRIVKTMFTNAPFRLAVALSGVNSINWSRIVAQVVYYFTAGVALGAPDRKISFCVPTGNFGDILAGWVAKRMGLPIDRLIIATNTNDILARTLQTGRYEASGVVATSSPSMDIQVSSNFERLLYEACGRDAEQVSRWMDGLKQSGSFSLSEEALAAVRADFSAGRADETAVARTMKQVLADSGMVLDPHTAVGIAVAKQTLAEEGLDPSVPIVTLATAHPAKFPAAVEEATGVTPRLPSHLHDLMEREERMQTLANDQATVERFVLDHARIAQPA
ncbi:MAG: threonine synthase [Devosiaceae bacterium]|nr:threonine synthase [Devosiaceae bacterium MH13]